MILSIGRILLKEFLRKEIFEPEVSRAILITLALLGPVVVAHYLGKPMWAILPGIGAQLLVSAKIEVTLSEKMLILFLGGLACSVAAFIGTLSGAFVWSAILFLGIIAGIASMARGIAEYGQTFGLSAVILFLISLSPPNVVDNAVVHGLIVLGGVIWALVLTLVVSIFTPSALSKATATPWYFSTLLMQSVSHPKWTKKDETWTNQKEIDLRISINNILPWIKKKRKVAGNHRRETLKLVRAASRLGSTAITLQHELKALSDSKIPISILLSINKCTSTISTVSKKVTEAIVKPINLESLRIAITNATFSVDVLIQSIENEKLNNDDWARLFHIVSLYESAIHYEQDALLMFQRIEKIKGKGKVANSSNLSFIIKEYFKKAYIYFQPDSILLKHSLRVALMTSLGLLIYYIFDVPRGYWIVLSIMVLLQPEFGNTWKKAQQRMIGTLLGGLIGTCLVMFTVSFHFTIIRILLIAISCFFTRCTSPKTIRLL